MLGMKKDAKNAAKSKEVHGWMREILALPKNASMLVTELTYTKPECPPVETVIAVLRGPGQNTQVKIHRALAEITREDVAQVAGGTK